MSSPIFIVLVLGICIVFNPYGVEDRLWRKARGVASARIIMDRATGKSKGFGFVEIPNDAEVKAAIGSLDGKDLKGRPLRVNESIPKDGDDRGPHGGGGGYGRSC